MAIQRMLQVAFSEHREVELKFRLANLDPFAVLRQADRLLGQFELSPICSQDTLDLYWDTPDYALARGGFGLRTRRQNGRWLVTLKELSLHATDALTDRVEVESEWAEKAMHDFLRRPRLGTLLKVLAQPGWPPPAWSQVVLTKRNPHLQVVAPLHQHRDKRDLSGVAVQHGEVVGELSLDTVRVYPSTPGKGTKLLAQIDAQILAAVGTFYELELEARDSTSQNRLAEIAEPMASAFDLEPSVTGKAESALRLLARVTPDGAPAIQPTTSMIEAGRAIWRQQLVEMILGERGVRCQQDAEAVHDMRVAIRRIRAANRIFGPFFDQVQIAPYARKLRKTARILGAARDLDIALDLINDCQKTLTSAGEALQPVITFWQAERRTAYAAVQKWLTGKAYSRFLTGFAAFCHTPGTDGMAAHGAETGGMISCQVRHVLPTEIFERYARMRAYEVIIEPDVPVQALHRLRIEGKRLRYAVEFVQHLLAPTATAYLLRQLKALQDCLGAINDAAVMQDRLRTFAGTQQDVASLEALIAYLDSLIEQQRATFGNLWAEFTSLETRTQLALAIAPL
jgi:CHAD domain-containing protein